LAWVGSRSERETLRIVVLDAHTHTHTHTSHMYTQTYTHPHILIHSCNTWRVMHIRRLLGNGFGLLMTGQLS